MGVFVLLAEIKELLLFLSVRSIVVGDILCLPRNVSHAMTKPPCTQRCEFRVCLFTNTLVNGRKSYVNIKSISCLVTQPLYKNMALNIP